MPEAKTCDRDLRAAFGLKTGRLGERKKTEIIVFNPWNIDSFSAVSSNHGIPKPLKKTRI